MVKRILALSLLMVGLAGCGSGGGAESELATENTLLSANKLGGGDGEYELCQARCGTIANGTTCMGTWMRVKNCESTRSINYNDCVSGC